MPTVLLTRPEQRIEPLKSQLQQFGFEVWFQPTIEIRPPDSWDDVDDAIRRIVSGEERDSFDWLVFSSSSGVDFFFDRLRFLLEDNRQEADPDPEKTAVVNRNADPDFLRPIRFAVVGPGTGETLRKRSGRRPDVLPELFSAEGVLDGLLEEAEQGQRFLLLRASRGRDVLRQHLTEAGGHVTEVVAYQSVDLDEPDPDIAAAMEKGEIDWVTVTSSSIARSLIRLFGERLRKTRLLSISPITSDTLRDGGFVPDREAREPSLEGLVEALTNIDESRESL